MRVCWGSNSKLCWSIFSFSASRSTQTVEMCIPVPSRAPRCDVWSICSTPERQVWHWLPPHFKNTSIKSVKNVRDLLLVIVGYFSVIDGLMVGSLSPLCQPSGLISYPCINLHTMCKITNDNILKNDSQYPLAILINSPLLVKIGGGKTATDGDREGEKETCQAFFLYWHLWLRGCEKNVFVCADVCVS